MRGGATGRTARTARQAEGLRGEVVLVCGPPAAGKTTWVRKHARPGDLVIDFDEICRQLGSRSRYDHPPQVRAMAKVIRPELERMAAEAPGRAFIIRSLPDPQDRAAVARRLGARVVVLATPVEEAIKRARADHRPAWTERAIQSWWDRYAPSQVDEASEEVFSGGGLQG
ncbi:AAA family ATPase [uncultured Thermomonospora sp.]|uniref:AAA family ATPase n=1 Tax=uncultured Thermomonospora sp. TaxID=671175 RepID=UPI00259B11C1|nr:AAA family ATPase [uncultured Thermomonospora sp.]